MMKKKGSASDHRGFTLMEFVIVVAIIALLIGIMAPQLMKYVEKSRAASDRQALEQIFRSCSYEYLTGDYTPGQLSSRYFNGIGSGGELPASGVPILHIDRNGFISLNYANNFAPGEFLYESLAASGITTASLKSGGSVRLFKSSTIRKLAGSGGLDIMMRFDTRQVLCMWVGSPAAADGSLSDSCVPDDEYVFGDYEYH